MLDTYRELVDLLAQTPNKLKVAAAQASEAPEGEWGAAQVLGHMAAAEKLWLERLNMILRQKEALLKRGGSPEIAAYGQERLTHGVDENLAAFNALRGETISLMMGLSLTDWRKTGTHETRGELTIEDVVEDMVDHDSEHLDQLAALQAT